MTEPTVTLLVPGNGFHKACKIQVERSILMKMSKMLQSLIEDVGTEIDVIPVPNVSYDDLQQVLSYCRYQCQNPKPLKDQKTCWEKQFVQNLGSAKIFDVMLAANYLDIPPLLNLLCAHVAKEIRNCSTTTEIRQKFQIENDFTPEEEEEIQRQNAWAFGY